MLEISKLSDGRDLVEINFSSLSVINECMRKSEYLLLRKLRAETEGEALTFGKAIHKALEHWYLLPPEHRQLTEKESDLASTLITLPLSEPSEPYETALDSINAFIIEAQSVRWLAPEDKRSLASGVKILKAYFKHYADDGLEVYRDESGKPYVERECEFIMHEDAEKVIKFHGTIDIILRNTISGQLFVADHKTTAALGSAFYNRIKPNHQYTGYIWAARECLGIHTDSFLVNGIQVAKTKSEFARQPTQRNEEDFAELKIAMIDASERMLKAIKTGIFPMNSGACTNYGQCSFYEICSAPAALRENIIRSKYGSKG
jgi:hypothetical protein